jgi:hypothetical protein
VDRRPHRTEPADQPDPQPGRSLAEDALAPVARRYVDDARLACWFIDSNYNGESFFVRHAYFTGNNDPCAQLRRALRADIDVDAWQSLYSTVSRPFPMPETGKIAVKVINHYGDEVLQVYGSSP